MHLHIRALPLPGNGILSDSVFKITWDTETGGVLLSSKVTKETLGISPRPVWFEELDLLGLDRLGYTYPKADAPLMWAVNKQYFYRGKLMFEAKGANIYDAPTVVFKSGGARAALEPVDVREMLRRNADLMFLLESEAIEFIRDTFTAYSGVNRARDAAKANQEIDFEALAEKAEKKAKRKMAVVKEDCDSFDVVPLDVAQSQGKRVVLSTRIDRFIASFSGGKDSQVVLDLCTRAIPPTAFEVIYSDTGYELPPSLELYEQVKRHYSERFPSLKFSTTRNHESVLNYWDKIGTPSDTHRWCCSVMKTAPLYRSLKVEGNRQARVLAFDGVRAEESTRRSSYNRIGKGVKHSFVIDARPILEWNTTEIFLYLMKHNLPINEAYRFGKPRVGCIFCPFGSPWDDMIVNQHYSGDLNPFIDRIERIVTERKIPNAKEYIKERRWKLRSSGTNTGNKTEVVLSSNNTTFSASVKNPKNSLLLWFPTIGPISYHRSDSITKGIFSFDNTKYSFQIIENNSKANIAVDDNNNVRLRYYLRRIIYKCAYCINCEACEIECPTGALSVYPKVIINDNKCIHCFKCIDFHQHGCIVADSLVTTMSKETNNKISPYGTFGIQESWVEEFLSSPLDFWENNTLGVKQVPSFKAWLKDAELIDDKISLTPLGEFCSNNKDDFFSLIWEIIYINLCYNNSLMKWFLNDIEFDKVVGRKEIEAQIQDYFAGAFAKSSISYALRALLQVFKYSPIGTELKQFESINSKGDFIRNRFDDLSDEGLVYSIYRFAKDKNVTMCRVADFYNSEETHGPVKEFGISRKELLKKLRALSINKDRVLLAELNMGLDHITLREDIDALDVLKILTK